MMPMHKQLRAIGELLKLDCGDNSCLCVAEKRGMRTNGGCRCDIAGAVRKLVDTSTDFVENREEATERIWYVSGGRGRELLEALGIPYVEKG